MNYLAKQNPQKLRDKADKFCPSAIFGYLGGQMGDKV